MSDIPKARAELMKIINDSTDRFLGEDVILGRIISIFPLLWRDTPCRRAPTKRQRYTAEVKRRVKEVVRAKPDKTMHEIATELGIRNGKR